MARPFQDLTGQQFEYWTVVGPHESRLRVGRGTRTMWYCRCVCGTHQWVDATNLKGRVSTNCGCKRTYVAGKGSPAALGASKANRTHGMSGRRLYTVWARMKQRCYDPNDAGYKYYGAQGIKVCDSWQEFNPFAEWALNNGYTDTLTIERHNVKGDYCPENCCFIPKDKQNRNTRRTFWITPTQSLADFCEEHNVPYDLVWHALKLKMKYPTIWTIINSI